MKLLNILAISLLQISVLSYAFEQNIVQSRSIADLINEMDEESEAKQAFDYKVAASNSNVIDLSGLGITSLKGLTNLIKEPEILEELNLNNNEIILLGDDFIDFLGKVNHPVTVTLKDNPLSDYSLEQLENLRQWKPNLRIITADNKNKLTVNI